MLVYEHGNRSGAKGVILSQPLGPTDPRFEPTAAPGGLPALSHFLGGPVGMPGLGHILRVPSHSTSRSAALRGDVIPPSDRRNATQDTVLAAVFHVC